jgi:hypothetical protein
MDMQKQIEAILSGVSDKSVNQVGHLWQIRVGGRSGARADGIGLARELLQEYIKPRPVVEPVPEPEPAPILVEEPVQVGHMDEPEPIEIPTFLTPDPMDAVPDALRLLAEPGESTQAMQARLWSLYLELNGKLMLNLASPEEIALHSRLHNELHWIAPTIEGET